MTEVEVFKNNENQNSHNTITRNLGMTQNFETTDFTKRHTGPDKIQQQKMLQALGFQNLSDLISKVIPKNILSKSKTKLSEGLTEQEALKKAWTVFEKNKVFKNYIGMGFHETHTPTIIQRNILENPVWYTAYTPYQAEISQGRLEALLNFQTLVTDLTGMEISNASLLDEATAAAEAVNMAANITKNKSQTFFASNKLHPYVLEVLKTRSEPLGLNMIIDSEENLAQLIADNKKEFFFAAVVSYPHTDGKILNQHTLKNLTEQIHAQGGLMIADVDLLSLTLLSPPGEWGADIVVGNSQRFGVPMGFGGPHAAFLSTKNDHKRLMPGRLVGVSIDRHGKPALRLTLQTREQHIRREKATSNICTAQVLLANMASMYAVYHGPIGLKEISSLIHAKTKVLFSQLEKANLKPVHSQFFDTLVLDTTEAQKFYDQALRNEINLRKENSKIYISLSETTSPLDLQKLLQVFGISANLDTLKEEIQAALTKTNSITNYRTSSYLNHPTFNSYHSETELLRYIHHLQNKDVTLTHSMIALGSCTMKLNATSELVPVSWKKVGGLHPFAPLDQCQGMLEMITDLESQLCKITGFAATSLQPNAGSQGEYAGLLVIRKYHLSNGQTNRNVCLIPSSAHGTNPASAVMAGFEVVVVNCDASGNVDVSDLKQKAELHSKNLGALMITYPSTHGVFEESITEICEVIHKHGGQVYMDGANMNALVEICRPGEFGPDVMHMNLHKTFAIPHGGGGPGVGPIAVAKQLAPFLPKHELTPDCGPKDGVSAVSATPWGSASILPIPWLYITMMGASGLKEATEVAILNANYVAHKLKNHYPILYTGKEGMIAHECILDLRPLKKTSGIDVVDVAKRLIDYGFHAPTMSFPVAGTLMVEPTESESLAELDRFIEAMISIKKEIDEVEQKKFSLDDNVLVNSPHTAQELTANEWKHSYSREKAAFPANFLRANKYWPVVGRVDNAYGDKNVICSCPSIEDFR